MNCDASNTATTSYNTTEFYSIVCVQFTKNEIVRIAEGRRIRHCDQLAGTPV